MIGRQKPDAGRRVQGSKCLLGGAPWTPQTATAALASGSHGLFSTPLSAAPLRGLGTSALMSEKLQYPH